MVSFFNVWFRGVYKGTYKEKRKCK
jgi:hypothetical protein